MRQSWKQSTVGEMCTLMTGGTPQSSERSYYEGGDINWVVSGDIHKKQIWDCEKKITKRGMDNSNARMLPRDSVLIALNGIGKTRGTVAMLRVEATCNQSIVCMTPRDPGALSPEFLFHFLNGQYRAIRNITGEKDRRGLNMPLIRNIEIPIPPLQEQQHIVAILDEVFAELATATTNADKNLENALELFDSVSKSLLEDCNENWERLTLETLLQRGWIISHLDGNHGNDYPRKEEFVSNGVPYLSANCLDGDNVDLSLAKFLSPERAALLRKGIAQNNDVLFAHNATVGPVAMLYTDEPKVILSTSLTYYRCDPSRMVPEYLAHYMRSPKFKDQYKAVMRQSTRNQVPITKQREFVHLVPPIDKQREIAKKLDSLRIEVQRLDTIYRQMKADVSDLKQTILRKVFSAGLPSPRKIEAPSAVSVPRAWPIILAGISPTDLHAGIIAIAHQKHQGHPKQNTFGHVKAEKIAHVVEAEVGIELDRNPIKDAAGPNDYRHLKKVESRADKAGFFSVRQSSSGAYVFVRKNRFDELIDKTRRCLGERNAAVDAIIDEMLPMDTQQAEIFATVYAAWNNLLIDGRVATDEAIVSEAREDWHPDKLKISRDRFFTAIEWMRAKGIIPTGSGKKVFHRD